MLFRSHGVAVVVVDIIKLKSINARAGHIAGDQALRALGRIVRRVTRAGDVVGRIHGDAFGVVLRDPTDVGPLRLALRVQELVQTPIITGPGGDVTMSVSIGFSCVESPSSNDREAAKDLGASDFDELAGRLLACALGALEEAQASGGNAVRAAPPVTWRNV